ncbi:DUF488 family protein [Candidatus Bipolaricaulota bacterium]|nr:DUF488 family protein [Candidatus Bipolaricaulota bacterium]
MTLRQTYLSMKKKLPADAEVVLVMHGRGNDELAPSKDLLSDFNRRKAEFRADLGYATAFHYAWNACEFESRFRELILSNPASMARLQRLAEVSRKKDIYLVCYEGEDKPCHRKLLLQIAKEQFGADVDEKPFEP